MNDPGASNGSNGTGSCSISSPSKLSNLDVLVLEGCIDDVLSSLTERGLRCKLLESGTKLRDVVQPVASDFSKLFESIAEGAKIISDQKSSSSKISSEAQSVALDAVKQLGNAHWAAIGLLAIANVLERFDKISTNDRDCLDLLKLMLDLAKFVKQLKEMNADSHKELSEKMNEALHLIVSGAILCRSFIAYKKMLKFLFTTKIRDELVYVRRKVDSIIGQLSLQMQIKVASFYLTSQQQPYPNPPGGLTSEQSTTTNEIRQCEMEAMLKELMCMVNLRHKNIAKLVGFCNIRKEELMLVYDYLPNGRLSEFIFGGYKQDKILNWSERLKIILGVIRALVYLHAESVQEKLYCVHRDIKPENILLDDNFNAKLIDFHLAEFIPFDDDGFISVVQGTMGYIAPECISQGHLSYKSDIYSFGVLVLSIISGKRAIDFAALDDNDDVLHINRAWRLYREDKLADLIHPDLLDGEGCELSGMIRCIKIALWCVVKDPSLRPTTQRVSAMLSTEEEIPPLPDDSFSMELEPHSSEQSGSSSVQSREGRHSEAEIEEIEDLPRDWKAFD